MRTTLALLALAACTTEPLDADVDLAEAIGTDALMAHLETLEAIADAHDSTRLFLSEGYADSVDYVVGTLEDAGYDVAIDTFDIVSFSVNEADVAIIDGDSATSLSFEVFTYSGSGEVEAAVVPVDLTLPPGPPNSSTSGCEAADFEGFPAGAIALVQRGTCRFADKIAHAEAAGAAAVIVFNEGQEGRRDVVQGTLSASALPAIPVVGVGFLTGEALAEGATVRVVVDAAREVRQDRNVIAQTAGGDPARVVMLGAHLDSVEAGPGINDNGSGTAFLLELAVQLAALDVQPANAIRFAWWGAEEQGLIGSGEYFFDELGEPAAAVDGVEAYLNFDMIASGNGGRFVYDGDESDFRDGVANAGSAEIERLFLTWFADNDQAVGPEGLLIPSDSYWPALIGIPTGGLFSGASRIKTEEEAELFGGEAGEWRDPCYHQACDRVENTDPVLFAELAKAGAAVAWTLANRPAPLPAERLAPRSLDWRTAPRPAGCHDHVSWDR